MVLTTVHVVRHGEVDNPDRVLYGRLPGYSLSERGHAMATVVARALADRDITLVVASPLLRAQQTAAPIAALHHLGVGTDARLIEAENVFEGEVLAGASASDLVNPDRLKYLYNPFRPSWGEPFTQQRDRMVAAVATARERAYGHEAVLVSHQSPIYALRRTLQRKPLWHDPRTRECSLASVTSLVFDDARLIQHRYAEPAADLVAESTGGVGA